MKKFFLKTILLILTCFISIGSDAQFVFQKFPQNNSLVARNLQTNQGIVNFDFSVTNALNPDSVFLKKYEDNMLVSSKKVSYSTMMNLHQFLLNDTLYASLHNYHYELWYGTNQLVKKAEKVCCGDFYIIDGQSNAESMMQNGSSLSDYNDFIRTYGNACESGYNKEWSVATGDGNRNSKGHIGQLGIAIANNIVQKNAVPVCFLNGAVGGKEIVYFLRDESNRENQMTAYGRLYKRTKESEALENIRAIIWYQGENDAYGGTTYKDYLERNEKLYNAWKSDYKNLENIYFCQVKLGCNQNVKNTGYIQQAQLDMQRAHKDISVISTANIPHTTDNCHLDYLKGYKVLGNKLYRLIDFYQYSSPDSLGIFSPAVSTVWMKNKTQLSLKIKNVGGLICDSDVKQDFYLNKSLQKPLDIKFSEDAVQLFFEKEIAWDDSVSYSGHSGGGNYTIADSLGNTLLCFYGMKIHLILSPGLPGKESSAGSEDDINNNPSVQPIAGNWLDDSVAAYVSGKTLFVISKYNQQLKGAYILYDNNGNILKKEDLLIWGGSNIIPLDLKEQHVYILSIQIKERGIFFRKDLKLVK